MSLTTLDKKQNRTPTRVVSLDVENSDREGRVHLGQVYERDSLPIDPRNSHDERGSQIFALEGATTPSRTHRWSDAPDRTGLPGRPGPACHRARRERRTIRR